MIVSGMQRARTCGSIPWPRRRSGHPSYSTRIARAGSIEAARQAGAASAASATSDERQRDSGERQRVPRPHPEELALERARGDEAAREAQRQPDAHEPHAVAHHQAQHVERARPEHEPHPELARALRHQVRHHAEEPDPRERQRQRRRTPRPAPARSAASAASRSRTSLERKRAADRAARGRARRSSRARPGRAPSGGPLVRSISVMKLFPSCACGRYTVARAGVSSDERCTSPTTPTTSTSASLAPAQLEALPESGCRAAPARARALR